MLDHQKLISQLCGLERRTSRGGRDSIDHAPGGHDDIANAVAGVSVLAAARRRVLEFRRGYDMPALTVAEAQRRLDEETKEAALKSAASVEETIRKVGVWGFNNW